MFRTFPTFGAFIFWLLWPWFVVNFTARAYRAMSGKHIPKDRLRTLRKSLADNAKAIMKPVSTNEESIMPKPQMTIRNSELIAAATGGAAGAVAVLIAGYLAFRVPKSKKHLIPSKKDKK